MKGISDKQKIRLLGAVAFSQIASQISEAVSKLPSGFSFNSWFEYLHVIALYFVCAIVIVTIVLDN